MMLTCCGTIRGTGLGRSFTHRWPKRGCARSNAGYVEQTNSLISELTVAEMLLYTAELKRDPQEPLKVGSPTWQMRAVGNACTFLSRVPHDLCDIAESGKYCRPYTTNGCTSGSNPDLRQMSFEEQAPSLALPLPLLTVMHCRAVQAKRDVVDRVIAELSLQSCRNTRIGSATHRGISGGEVRGA